jgi:hypothetical protein
MLRAFVAVLAFWLLCLCACSGEAAMRAAFVVGIDAYD